jgi:prepilin-type N-terminal cleavage/methylation domain-containing protein
MTLPGRRPERGAPGFTLVEVLVAVVLLAIGILGLSATVGVVGWYLSAARLQTQVNARAQAEIERMLASAYLRPGVGGVRDGAAEVGWEVADFDPQRVWVVVRRRLGPLELADTLAVLVR